MNQQAVRNAFLGAALICMAIIPCSAQQPTVAEVLAGLRSADVKERSEALEHLRSDSVALCDSKVKAALVGLLDRENKEPVHGEEEGFAEYTSWLADTVAKIVDWKNPRQVCILANSVDLPDELSDHARAAVPCLLGRLKNGLNRYTPGADISRGSVVAMLVQALAKGRNDLDAATIQTVQKVILSALHDPDEGVRIETVKAPGKFGGEDVVPALKEVAEKDASPEIHGFSISRWAAEAITEIEKRADQH